MDSLEYRDPVSPISAIRGEYVLANTAIATPGNKSIGLKYHACIHNQLVVINSIINGIQMRVNGISARPNVREISNPVAKVVMN